jgi:AbiTii
MSSLVLQLQAECLDSNVAVSDVLRKALVVARKLSLTDALTWVEKELSGYKSGDAPPPYRILTGLIRAWNPYQGWVPVVFEDTREAKHFSQCFVGQAVGELEALLKHGEGTLQLPFDPDAERHMMAGFDIPVNTTRHLDRSSVKGVIDAVRNLLLVWSLQLEKDGVLGEGLTFSAREKEVASHANYTINYNASVGNSQIQQGSPRASQSITVAPMDLNALGEFIHLLNAHVPELNLDSPDTAQLQADVQTIETQLTSPRQSRIIIQECIRSITNILEGCAGSILASGLLHRLMGISG